MKNTSSPQCPFRARSAHAFASALLFTTFLSSGAFAQCLPVSGKIEGIVFNDVNNNGTADSGEEGLPNVLVLVHGADGQLLGSGSSGSTGAYSFSGLPNGASVRLTFGNKPGYYPARSGQLSQSSVQQVKVPSCNNHYGLTTDVNQCNTSTEILTTCFVQGDVTARPAEPTIVGIEYGFQSSTPARKFAAHGETGSIWGLAWKNSTKEIFSAAFIKQYAGLKNGHDAIFRTSFNGTMYTTQLFAKLSALGQQVGSLPVTDITDCAYGEAVGRMGLGGLAISPDEKYIYVVNIYNNTLVRIQTSNPTSANTKSYQIPGNGGYAFALKYYNGQYYVGVTYPGDVAKVVVFDPASGHFTDTGLTVNAGSPWVSSPVVGSAPSYWLTDIDFTDNGDMLIALSDRIGNIYCNSLTNRLDEQKGDLLIAWKQGNSWVLEDRTANGEFFSDDFWATNPAYHPEVTLGGIFVMPGTNSVVSTVFDPELNSYSGGLHRYNTTTGKRISSKELYTKQTEILFGKATGFGDVIATCGLPDTEIGNLVWLDANKNGLQDAGEQGLAGVVLELRDASCTLLATVTTDAQGHYAFNGSNVAGGISRQTAYTVHISNTQYDQETGSFIIAGLPFRKTKQLGDFDLIDSNLGLTGTVCGNHGFNVQVSSTQHSFDIGFVPAGDCNLSLSKKATNQNGALMGSKVGFEMTVANLGETVISQVEITDKLPAGYTFQAAENPLWSNNGGVLKIIISQRLLPGQTVSVPLTLGFDAASKQKQFTNEARISALKDGEGKLISDLSFCFNEASQAIDRDAPKVCDLALIHKVDTDKYYSPQSEIHLTTTVCNQGSVAASGFTIINYLNESLDFDPSLNPGWTISQDLTSLTFKINEALEPGACRNIPLVLSLQASQPTTEIINYAEIASCQCNGVEANQDFDSTPDSNKSNDKGGHPKTATDNTLDGNGTNDEDDQDPALIRLDLIDLSLTKTAGIRRTSSGNLVTFNLAVKNEGQVPVSKVKVVDYIPSNMVLEDATWTQANGIAEKILTIPGNLQPGNTVTTQILMKVKSNVVAPATLYNTAEIMEMYDQYGNNVSLYDIDSTPDNIMTNDASGNQSVTVLEDDISSAFVVVEGPLQYVACGRCRQGTTADNGQFETTVTLTGKSDEIWWVESSVGLFDFSSSLPPAPPVLLAEGTMLTQTPHYFDGHSFYTLNAVHMDGQGYSLRLRNQYGDLEQVEVTSGTCQFQTIQVEGPRSLCESAPAKYKATTTASSPSYSWFINGMYVTSGQLLNMAGSDWGYYGSTDSYVVRVEAGACIAPYEFTVKMGEPDRRVIACLDKLNVTLDNSCSYTITPAMLTSSLLPTGAPYTVLLKDAHGHEIPDARLTTEHAGTSVMAMLIEGCGGNTCWATIKVEDKTPPVSICRSITLPCYQLDEYEGPFETDNCGGPVQNVLVSEKITPLFCNDNYVKFLDRIYQATDKFGNKSARCTMRISLERLNIENVTFPRSFLIKNDSALVCDRFEKDNQGHPSPEVTGVPYYGQLPLYPSIDAVCNVSTWYADTDLGYIGCTRKIMRKWTVYEFTCNDGEFNEFTQVIEIKDTVPPVIQALPDMLTTTDVNGECLGYVQLPVPQVTDVCNNHIEIDVAYPGGFIDNIKNPVRIALPLGEHVITYTAYDGCGNSAMVTFTATVEDHTAPSAQCKGIIVTSLNSQGESYILARNVDDGTYDACGLVALKIARVPVSGLVLAASWADAVDFACADAGKTIMVALLATDESGNKNSCMMSVIVQDKHVPKITCPPTQYISCSDIFTGMSLLQFGDATAIDACGAKVTEGTPLYQLNACRVGKIVRTFTATDNLGTASCTQEILVDYEEGFNPNTDIVWPSDYTVMDKCGAEDLKPENLPAIHGYPKLTQSSCGLAASQYEDDVYSFVSGACYKIVRNWTVIDWCEMERLGEEYEPVTHQQIIKVVNTVPPFFVGTVAERDTFFTFKGNCNEGLVELKVTGRDICTPDDLLRWQYKIDSYNNGQYDVVNHGTGNMASISFIMPVGWHRVQWTFEDQCGNVVTKDQLILVRDNEKPKAESLDNVSISVVPADTDNDGVADMETACVFAWTLNVNSTSLCCDEPLRFSYSADVNDTLRCFNCIDVGETVKVQLWVHDCNGNTDFTELNIDVQDNNNSDVCETICERFGPNAQIAGRTTICPGTSTVLTASGGTKYLWSNGQTTASITVNPATSTTYAVTVTNELKCSATATALVTVSTPPVASIQGNNICLGNSTTLTASGGAQYRWSTGQTSNSIVVSPTTNTPYSVTVTNQDGCTATASRTIVVNPLPTASISGDANVCINESTTLTAAGGASYRWNSGATTSSITVTPSVNTQYTVTVTNASGCTATTSRTVVVNGLTINVAITGTNTICTGSNTTLTASGGNAYVWSTSATTPTINVAPLSSTTYRVTATDANGCTGISSTTVTVNALPQVNVTGNNVCQGASTTIAATGGGSYLWSTGQTSASFTATPANTTTYVVTVTNAAGCSATGSRQITVNPVPAPTITGTSAVCLNQSTTLTASALAGATYLWSNGATTANITVTPTANTTYTVTVTSQQGCTGSSSRLVTVNGSGITIAVTGNNVICSGQTTTLTATGGATYVWNTGGTGASLTIAPTANTTYSVTATDQNGCTGTGTRAVTVNPLPTARITGNAIICTGQSTTLTATGGTTYTWSTGQTSSVITVSPTAFTNYRVTVSDANGCTNTASLSVVVNPLPTAAITGDFSICLGESTTLTATGGTTYAWTNGATTASITVNPSSSQVYRVTVTNANNCTNTATATVTVSPPPTVNITGDLTICVGESTTLTASAGSSYQWSTGATVQAVTVSPTVNTAYVVTVTNANGCTGTATVTVQVDPGTLSCSTQNITVYLNAQGAVSIKPEDVSTSTFGLCSNIQSSVNPSNFFCNDVGIRTVTLTVTNLNNNQSLNCTAQVTVRDTIKPTLVCPASQSISCGVFVSGPLTNYGSPFASDNCAVGLQLVETPLVNLGACNIGFISRTFVVTDFSGNSRQCVQIINVTNTDPFTEADINWPADITVNNCGTSTDPSVLGNTTVDQNTYSCANINIGFRDNFPLTGPLCGGTYQRTWTVRDLCQESPGSNAGIFTHVQTIVVNTVPPVISGPTDTIIYVNATTCEARLDGVFHTSSGCNLTLSNSINTNANFNVSGVYPTGITNVILTARESCNNLTDTHSFVVEVVDTSSFNIQCVKTFPHITDNLTVDEPAHNHTVISYNCNNQQDIVVSYSNSNINDTIRTYDCTDVGSLFPITVYFWHIGDPVPFTLCSSIARVEDPANFCLTPSPRIAGLVNTENGQAVPHVQIDLEGSPATPAETGMNGLYTFPEMQAGGSYTVHPSRNDNPLDGVSTLDLIMIQRHVLGVQPITSPYRMIAADINHDNKISTADMLQLRKVLLGLLPTFPDNTSWRLIDKAFSFPDPKDPFLTTIKENYSISQLNNTMVIDWVGVKVGDINGSYETRFDGKQTESRSQNSLLRMANQALVNGENLIPVYAAKDENLAGLQTSVALRFASNAIITAGKLDIEDANYAFRNGVLHISWSQQNTINVNEGDILFYINLFTNQESSLSDVFGMVSSGLADEYYTGSTSATPFNWRIEDGPESAFTVHGNNPNPWDDETFIHFTLPLKGKVTLQVRDITGRLLHKSVGDYESGSNTIRISREQLGATGILLYDLTYGKETVTLKMLNLK